MRSASSCIAFLVLTSTLSLLTSAQSNAFIHTVEFGTCEAMAEGTVTVGISTNVASGTALNLEYWAFDTLTGDQTLVALAETTVALGQVEFLVDSDITTTFAAVATGGVVKLMDTDATVELDCIAWNVVGITGDGVCTTGGPALEAVELGSVYHLEMADATKNVGEVFADYKPARTLATMADAGTCLSNDVQKQLHGYGTTQSAGSNTSPVFLNEVLIDADCSTGNDNTGVEVVGIGNFVGDVTIVLGSAVGDVQETAAVKFEGLTNPEVIYTAASDFSNAIAAGDIADGFAMLVGADGVVHASVAWGSAVVAVEVTTVTPKFMAYPLHPFPVDPAVPVAPVKFELTGTFSD
eukprot:Selendium_serpulae@DN6397_c0_g1_i1.p1